MSLVIPTLNEARNLAKILPELPALHQVILVDGGSVDGTIDVAEQLLPHIDIVQQSRRGKGNALACGFAAATGDIVVMFDADGSADPAEIPRFIDTLLAGADFAKGTRFRSGGGSLDITRFRSIGNRILNTVANTLLGSHYTDLCYGYNAFWRAVAPAFDLADHTSDSVAPQTMPWGDGFEIETILTCRAVAAGLSITEVPSVERARLFGDSNLHALRDGLRVLRTILVEARSAGRQKRAGEDRPTGRATHIATSTRSLPVKVPTS